MTSTSCWAVVDRAVDRQLAREQAVARRDQLARVGAIKRDEHRAGALGLDGERHGPAA
jgi:hypothetical protein